MVYCLHDFYSINNLSIVLMCNKLHSANDFLNVNFQWWPIAFITIVQLTLKYATLWCLGQFVLDKKFQKLSARPTGGENSTGLGLSIVKALVDHLGGQIELVSNPGTGAEFKMTFTGVPMEKVTS